MFVTVCHSVLTLRSSWSCLAAMKTAEFGSTLLTLPLPSLEKTDMRSSNCTAQVVAYGDKNYSHPTLRSIHIHRVLKTKQNCFCQNFVKFPPTLIIFGTNMAKIIKLCEVRSFSTAPNLWQRTTMLNAAVPNCYITLRLLASDCSHLQFDSSTEGAVYAGHTLSMNSDDFDANCYTNL